MNIIPFLGLCTSVVILVALVALVYMLFNKKPNKVVVADTSAAKPSKPQKWLLPLGIAFIIAIWTIWGALFFIAVVWLLRMNPGSDISFTVSSNEKKAARQVYTWLFWSSIIAVPIFIGANFDTSSESTINERVLTALIPLIIHILLLTGLTSKSAFVYRHTQQGILLIALRAGMASLAAAIAQSYTDYAIMLFLLGNGALWLFGSLFGWSQVSDGKCWFMERKGETIVLMDIKSGKIVAPESQTIQPNEADKKLEQILNSMNAHEKQIAKEKALEAFQSGIPGEVRKNALNILSILGEVEKF